MSWFNQIVSVTLLNLRSIPQRLAASLVAVFGVAAVVGVFAGVLSMASGFEKTMVAAGSEQSAVLLRAGSTGELSSGMSNEQANIIADAPGVLRGDSGALVSAELYVLVDVAKKSTGEGSNVPLRGVQSAAFDIRDNIRIIAGRRFEPGKYELIAGRGASSQFEGLNVGSKLPFGVLEWTVVGIFEDAGSVSESELWTDVRVLQEAYRRGGFQSVRVKLTSPEAKDELDAALKADPRIDVDVYNEKEFYSQQSKGLATFIRGLGYPLTVLMAIGAIFGALNTMYSSISARGKEIATLRAIGFGPLPILVSVIIESAILSIIGGLIGGGLAYLFLNGFTVSTLNGASFSQVVFDFAVSPDLLLQGLIAAIIIGLVGGLFPAVRAVRVPVATALREL